MLIQLALAIALMIFGGEKGLVIGSILLWYIFTVIFPALCGEFLERRFGFTLGMIIAFAPLWLPVLIAVVVGLCADAAA